MQGNPPTEFWAYLDELVAAHELVIDRPKGSAHPRYPEMIYPLDYGFLKGSTTVDGGGIDVWRGSISPNGQAITAIIATVDLRKADAEIKIMLNCTEEELQTALAHHNGQSMRGILIRRKA